ncbi:MAG TPA: hypothetical protein VGT41_05550 [Candidatus Babeliales bacterium]|nr:hypothetical protein [Candidatus Babeliales bacterium]
MQWRHCFEYIMYCILLSMHLNIVAYEYQCIDSAFGTNGIVITRLNKISGTLNRVIPSLSVKLQTDGKILLIGDSFTHNNMDKHDTIDCSITLVRYNSDGTPDASFGADGIVVVPRVGNSQCAIDCAVQSDGKILVAGRTYQRPEIAPDATLIRLCSNGSLDQSFGINGMVIETNGVNQWSNFFKVMIQQDHKIVTAGCYGTDDPASDDILNYCIYLVRYLSDGTIDTSFGVDGTVKTFVNVSDRPKSRAASRAGDAAYGATLQQDDTIIVVGPSLDCSVPYNLGPMHFDGLHCDGMIVRYTRDGILDSSFGGDSNGMVITSANAACNFFVDTTITPDNLIIALGTVQNESTRLTEFLLARYTVDGRLDVSFGQNGTGIVHTPIGLGNAFAKNILIADDGKLLVTGIAQWETGTQFMVIRYLPDGSIDTSFGYNDSGILTVSIQNNAKSFSLALQDDEKLIIAGDSSDGGQANFTLTRFLK